MAVREREHRRIQQDGHLTCSSGHCRSVSSTGTKGVYANTKEHRLQLVDKLRAGTRLTHLCVAQPSRRFHHTHCLVMDRIPCSRAYATFTRISDDNGPMFWISDSGVVAFQLGQCHLSSPVVCLRGSQRIRLVPPPRLGGIFRGAQPRGILHVSAAYGTFHGGGIIQWSFGEDVYPSFPCYLPPLPCKCVDGCVCICSRRRLPPRKDGSVSFLVRS